MPQTTVRYDSAVPNVAPTRCSPTVMNSCVRYAHTAAGTPAGLAG